MENSIVNTDEASLAEINALMAKGFTGLLGIRITAVEPGRIEACMMADKKTLQPWGYMHGGVSLVLEETVAGAGSALLIDLEKYNVLGFQVNGTHMASTKEGLLTVTAAILHQGKTVHIWDVMVKDEKGRVISTARVTNMIVEKR